MDQRCNQLNLDGVIFNQKLEQFRLIELQVFNWGTFSGIHSVSVSEDGMLIIGGSGSGKSTLFDAYSSLHTPTNWRSYNAASNNDSKGKATTRNDVSYLRGAWSKSENEDGISAKNYLRKGSTFSAIKATYENRLGKIVTLIQVLYIKGTSCDTKDIKKHWYVANIKFDLEMLNGFEYDFKKLDEKFDQEHFKPLTSFSQFEEHYMAKLGIENRLALRLLHKAQSAKNINNVNEFIRDYMLDETNTKRFASELVDEYASLENAYMHVIDLKKQVEALTEIRQCHQELTKCEVQIEALVYRLEYIEQFSNQIRLGLYETQRADLSSEIKTLEGEVNALETQFNDTTEYLLSLRMEWEKKGGRTIDDCIKKINSAKIELDNRSDNKKQAKVMFENIKEDFPVTERAFNDAIINIKTSLENFSEFEIKLTTERDQNKLEYNELNIKRTTLSGNISLLEQQQSRVKGNTARIRQKIAHELNLPLEDLPFVAELIQVKSEHLEWTGAIERVLHSFGLSILVQDQHYKAINDFVNSNHLGGRVVYYKVENDFKSVTFLNNSNSLLSKIDVKESVFDSWLLPQLKRQFDYQCVDSISMFNKTEGMVVTIKGLIKGRGKRHEKNDLNKIDDNQNWILGFSNKELIEQLREKDVSINENLLSLQNVIKKIEEKQNNNANIKVAYTELSKLEWIAIDEAEQVILIESLKNKLNELRNNSNHIETLESQINQCKSDLEKITVLNRSKLDNLALNNRDLNEVVNSISSIVANLQEIPTNIKQILSEEFEIRGEVSNIVNVNKRSKILNDRYIKQKHDNEIESGTFKSDMKYAMDAFKDRWPGESKNLVSAIEGAVDFITYLDDIERDGLIRHENNFRDLLNQQAVTRLTNLDSEIKDAYLKIEDRLEDVNTALKSVEYNPGTNLQIFPKKLDLEQVKEFKGMVQDILSFATTNDFETAQARFLKINELQKKLRSELTTLSIF